jgi:hypothetical protein
MRPIAPALLLALAPALARADSLENVLVPLGVVGTVFGFSAVMIGIFAYSIYRSRRLRHETIRLAIEKGQPLPPGLLDPVNQRDPLLRDLRRGLILLAAGIGVGLFLGLSSVTGQRGDWAVGFIPGLMGLAYLATYAITRRQTRNAQPDRE